MQEEGGSAVVIICVPRCLAIFSGSETALQDKKNRGCVALKRTAEQTTLTQQIVQHAYSRLFCR